MMRRLLLLAAIVALGACQGGKTDIHGRARMGGDPDRGERVIRDKGCGACHSIPGVRGAYGRVAPPLDYFSRRSFIAGMLPNNEENLVRWILDPRAVNPKTAMPALGLDVQDARDVAAYLYTLE